MKTLSNNWLTEGWIDFEYKKYLLLAYLKEVKNEFKEKKIYPVFSDLLFHYKNVMSIQQNKSMMNLQFPKEIAAADMDKFKLLYKNMVEDDQVMKELDEIMLFAIPLFKLHLEEGKYIYDEIDESLSFTSVGLISVYPEKGYLMLHLSSSQTVFVYHYETTIFTSSDEKYRGVHTHYLENFMKSPFVTWENLKVELARKYNRYTNPATFLAEDHNGYPFEASILPVAKRKLIKYLADRVA